MGEDLEGKFTEAFIDRFYKMLSGIPAEHVTFETDHIEDDEEGDRQIDFESKFWDIKLKKVAFDKGAQPNEGFNNLVNDLLGENLPSDEKLTKMFERPELTPTKRRNPPSSPMQEASTPNSSTLKNTTPTRTPKSTRFIPTSDGKGRETQRLSAKKSPRQTPKKLII